ncbi:peptidyl-prolyl cis-trans isomerase [bacterium]|nr:peptidyl-prolyl cis-trans isomerase [bacterium]
MTNTAAASDIQHVEMQTSEGTIVLALDQAAAPATVANFLAYADDGHYDGTVFHRVIAGFMVQGGGHDETLAEKPTREPIANEANNGLSNQRGTIAMARTNDPHSATAQFFINHGDNSRLDFRSETSYGWGYTVFGRVVEGMDVVDKIAALPTAPMGPFPSDVPQPLVVIESVRRIEPSEAS